MNEETILLRQVHPQFLTGGKLSSQAFFPFPKDAGRLSVYDSDLISPAWAFSHYINELQLQSVGVWGVSVEEVNIIALTSQPDPLPDFLAHAVIDFGKASINECRKLAKRLRAFAVARGCLYSPE